MAVVVAVVVRMLVTPLITHAHMTDFRQMASRQPKDHEGKSPEFPKHSRLPDQIGSPAEIVRLNEQTKPEAKISLLCAVVVENMGV